MLAEAFLVRLEMLRRTAASNQATGRSDTRFVPITPPREKDAAAVMDSNDEAIGFRTGAEEQAVLRMTL